VAQIKTYGIVLDYRDFSETSRMLTLFTPGMGLLSASAKGCRRIKSPLYAGSELYTFAEYVISENRGKYTLIQADGVESFYGLRSNIDSLTAAAQMIEFTRAIAVEGTESAALFVLLSRCLEQVAEYPENNPYMISLYYQMQALQNEGLLPDFRYCANCGRPASSAPGISPAAGGRLCHPCRNLFTDTRVLSAGTWKMLSLFRSSPLEMVPRLKMSAVTLRETENVWPELAASRLEKALRSPSYIAKIRKHALRTADTENNRGVSQKPL
jgi:DNA repair protein RecO (recombination protein O)